MSGRRAFRALAAALLLAAPLAARAQPLEREEIENARRYMKSGEPSFARVTESELRRSIAILASRNYAVIGYNTLEIRVILPASDNSAYAQVKFPEAKPLDAKGRVLPHQLEEGLYDHATHATPIRFIPAAGATEPVPLSRAKGSVRVRYPAVVRTETVRKGPGQDPRGVAIDGPYVRYDPKKLDLPEASFQVDIGPVRAYDAEGRRLELYDGVNKTELSNGVSLRTIAFWGPVAAVHFDTVEEWAEIELPFDRPPASRLPAGREGLKP